MHDCVIQRFPERQLNVGFCSRNTVRSFISLIKRSTSGEMA